MPFRSLDRVHHNRMVRDGSGAGNQSGGAPVPRFREPVPPRLSACVTPAHYAWNNSRKQVLRFAQDDHASVHWPLVVVLSDAKHLPSWSS